MQEQAAALVNAAHRISTVRTLNSRFDHPRFVAASSGFRNAVVAEVIQPGTLIDRVCRVYAPRVCNGAARALHQSRTVTMPRKCPRTRRCDDVVDQR